MAKVRKLLDAASKKIDDFLTPSELTKAQAAARRRTGRKLAKDKDPLKAFSESKDPAVKKLRAEKAAEAKAKASKTRAGQRKRQAAARKEAVDKRKSQIAKGAGSTAGATALVGAGAAAATGAKSSNRSTGTGTRSQTEGKRSTIKKERIGSGRSMYMLDGRLNISKDNLKDSGMTLREYANYMKDNNKRPPKAKPGVKFGKTGPAYAKSGAKKKAMGGMMKSKMASKGGAKGGRRPTGMKNGGMPMKTVNGMKVPAFAADGKGPNDLTKKMMGGGMMKSKMASKGGAKGGRKPGGMQAGGMMKPKGMAKGGKMGPKGYAKGGAMTKKGMAKGGSVRRNTKPRGVGAALRGYGKAMKK